MASKDKLRENIAQTLWDFRNNAKASGSADKWVNEIIKLAGYHLELVPELTLIDIGVREATAKEIKDELFQPCHHHISQRKYFKPRAACGDCFEEVFSRYLPVPKEK